MSAPRSHRHEVLELESGGAVAAAVPLLGERLEGRVELGGAAVAVRVLSRRDRRAVEGPEVLGELATASRRR